MLEEGRRRGRRMRCMRGTERRIRVRNVEIELVFGANADSAAE